MRVLFFLGLLGLLGCTVHQKPKQETHLKTVCRYSKYLHIYPLKKGSYRIQITDPDQQQALFSLDVTTAQHRIAVLSATHVGMLAELGAQQKVCAIPDLRFLDDPDLRKAVAQGSVVDLQSDQSLSIRKLLKQHTQVLVYSGFGSEKSQLKRLRALGVKCIPDYEWRETHPLARAEWILLFGVLTGQLKRAQAVFEHVCANYKRIREQATLCNTNPHVISGYIYGDQWVAPAGNSFEAKLYKDVDMTYYFEEKTGTGSCFSSISSILNKSTEVTIWLNPGQSSRSALLQNYPKYKFFPFFKKRIYCYTHHTNYYWERAAVHPDWVLSDLRKIRDHQTDSLYFYKELKP
ncbi:MAG: hypothetical protein RLZZ301_631 [Bacteroidota bacterium]|jgi:iron complex transport system substrate-binding protein